MRIFVNCSNLRFGGGITVGHNIIQVLSQAVEIEQLIVIAPADCGYEKFQNDKVLVKIIAPYFHNPVLKPFLNYYTLGRMLRSCDVDCVLSLGNIAFPSGGIPQFLLIHNPYLLYPESPVWDRLNFKSMFILKSMVFLMSSSLKNAENYFVQTETMKSRLCRLFVIAEQSVSILPNAISYTSIAERGDLNLNESFSAANPLKLLILSKVYPHKNFDILYDLGQAIVALKLPIIISVTLNEAENQDTKVFLNKITQLGLQEVIHNMGHVKMDQIAEIYNQHHGLFLPTQLESYSGTYIESMYFGRAIFTSDLDFAREVCREAAFYFDPTNVESIVAVFQQVIQDPKLIEEKINKGTTYLAASSDWNKIAEVMMDRIKIKLKGK